MTKVEAGRALGSLDLYSGESQDPGGVRVSVLCLAGEHTLRRRIWEIKNLNDCARSLALANFLRTRWQPGSSPKTSTMTSDAPSSTSVGGPAHCDLCLLVTPGWWSA